MCSPIFQAHVIAALVTTLLSVIVFMLAKKFITNVDIKETSPMFAVTR